MTVALLLWSEEGGIYYWKLCSEIICTITQSTHDCFIKWHHCTAVVKVLLVWDCTHDCFLYSESVFLSAVPGTLTQKTLSPFTFCTPSTPQPRVTVYHFAVRPLSWPHHPLLGVWQHQRLMFLTSSVTMTPLPPPALLSIVRLTVSGLVPAEDGAGAARSLCKW